MPLAAGRDGRVAAHDLSKRGRGEAAAGLVIRRWPSWRGRAVEPTIREALSLAAADLPWPEATAVGGWWNRAFDPEIDLVGADRGAVARKLWYAGSVKWLDHPFGSRDLRYLRLMPGAWAFSRPPLAKDLAAIVVSDERIAGIGGHAEFGITSACRANSSSSATRSLPPPCGRSCTTRGSTPHSAAPARPGSSS